MSTSDCFPKKLICFSNFEMDFFLYLVDFVQVAPQVSGEVSVVDELGKRNQKIFFFLNTFCQNMSNLSELELGPGGVCQAGDFPQPLLWRGRFGIIASDLQSPEYHGGFRRRAGISQCYICEIKNCGTMNGVFPHLSESSPSCLASNAEREACFVFSNILSVK